MIFWLCALALRTCVVGKQAWWFDLVLSVGGIVSAWRGLYDFQFSVDVAFLPVELVLGLVLFILSVLITARDPIRHLRATLESLLGSRRSVHRQAICGAIKTSIAEEVVWRVILQTALSSIGGPVVAVVVVALVFSSLHRRATGGFSWQLIDVFIFSLCLGCWTPSHSEYSDRSHSFARMGGRKTWCQFEDHQERPDALPENQGAGRHPGKPAHCARYDFCAGFHYKADDCGGHLSAPGEGPSFAGRPPREMDFQSALRMARCNYWTATVTSIQDKF